MKLSLTDREQSQQDLIKEHGRVIARGIEDVKVENQKNMAKADKRHNTMLERAAERVLSGR